MQCLTFAASATKELALHPSVVHDSWKRQKIKILSLPDAIVHQCARQEFRSRILSGLIL